MAVRIAVPFLALAGSDSPLSPCSCSCCETEVQRAAEMGGPDRFECAFAQPGLLYKSVFRAETAQCSNMCLQDQHDTVLTATEVQSIDTQRFCYFECEPAPDAASANPKVGDLCKSLARSEQRAVMDNSGNAVPPNEVEGVFPHFLARKSQASAATQAAVAAAARRIAQQKAAQKAVHDADRAALKAAAEGGLAAKATEEAAKADPWSSVAPPNPKQSAKVAEWAAKAESMAAKAAKDSKSVAKMATFASGSLPGAFATVEDAKASALLAVQDEKRVQTILETTRELVFGVAMEVVPETLKKMKEEARKTAKKEALKIGKAEKERMLAAVEPAAAAAAEPYKVAMNRAAAMAAEYAKRGDNLVGQATALQMDAQLVMGSAQQYLALGDMGLAQKLMQQGRMQMDLAVKINGAANGNYNQMAAIEKTLPAYMGEGAAASYHASVMLNPDLPPPPPPLVLIQQAASLPQRAPHDAAISSHR